MISSPSPSSAAAAVVKTTVARWRRIEHAGWLLACAVYVAVGATKIWPALRFAPVRPNEPFASTDIYLETTTGQAHASSRLLQILAPLPREQAIVLILPDNGVRSALINQAVCYLAWPREVRWLCADAPDVKEQLIAMSPSTVAAVIFWDTTPFLTLAGAHIGAGQIVIPVSHVASNQ
jgi:hypothetical protein